MELQVLQVLALCMQAKEKGHDVFFDYISHTDEIEVRIYKNGWVSQEDAQSTMRCDLLTNKPSEKILFMERVTVEEIIERLTNLIKED